MQSKVAVGARQAFKVLVIIAVNGRVALGEPPKEICELQILLPPAEDVDLETALDRCGPIAWIPKAITPRYSRATTKFTKGNFFAFISAAHGALRTAR